MADTTPGGAPFPTLSDAPNVAYQIQALAEWLDPRVQLRFASTAERDTALPAPVPGTTAWITGLGRSVYNNGRWNDEWWKAFTPRLWRGMEPGGTPSVTTYSSPLGRWRRSWDGMVDAVGKVTADWNVTDAIGMELPVAAANRDMTPIGSMWIIGGDAPTDQLGAAHLPAQLNIVVPIRRTRGYIALPGAGSDVVYRVRYMGA